MFIKEIKLENFRNYNYEKIELNEKTNIIFGDNAQGKTNILEAIFFASLGKSFRTNKEKELIKEKEQIAKVQIRFVKNNRDQNIKVEIDDKKRFFINDIPIKKLSELVGNINVVLFTPEDIEILRNEPARRRKFLNIMISQLRPKYMHIYSLYNKALEERNNYLKKIKQEKANEELLEIWDEQLISYGKIISEYRKEFIDKIKNKIKLIHKNITGEKEEIKIKYLTDCLDEINYRNLLKQRRKLDIIKGFTTRGIHRDDFEIYINNILVNTYGSQGQHRTAILSLKMAELQVIQDEIGEEPILLLDDFMSELDEKRRLNFLNNIKDNQVIITCTEKFEIENSDVKYFKVEDGEIFT